MLTRMNKSRQKQKDGRERKKRREAEDRVYILIIV